MAQPVAVEPAASFARLEAPLARSREQMSSAPAPAACVAREEEETRVRLWRFGGEGSSPLKTRAGSVFEREFCEREREREREREEERGLLRGAGVREWSACMSGVSLRALDRSTPQLASRKSHSTFFTNGSRFVVDSYLRYVSKSPI